VPGIVEPNRIYSALEVAKLLGIAPRTVETLTQKGIIPARKVGRRVLYVGQDLLDGLPRKEARK